MIRTPTNGSAVLLSCVSVCNYNSCKSRSTLKILRFQSKPLSFFFYSLFKGVLKNHYTKLFISPKMWTKTIFKNNLPIVLKTGLVDRVNLSSIQFWNRSYISDLCKNQQINHFQFSPPPRKKKPWALKNLFSLLF